LSSGEESQTSQFIRDNIVKIVDNNNNFYGTGFFIKVNNTKYCITCHHCIYKADEIFIQRDNQKYASLWIKKYSNMSKDLAVLQIENCPIESLGYHPQAMPKLSVLTWGFSGSKLKNFPRGLPAQTGNLSDESFTYEWAQEEFSGKKEWNKKPGVSINVFQYDGKFELGFSGAPVCYDADKKVVGLFIARDEENGYVLPIQTVLEEFVNETLAQPVQSKDSAYYISRGNECFYNKEFDEAIKHYEMVLDDMNYFHATFNKALSLRNLGKYIQALTWYDKALSIDENYVKALRGKGVTLFRLGRFNEALTWYDKALSINPNDVRSLKHKGDLLFRMQKYDEALEYYNKVLAIDRDSTEITEAIKNIHRMRRS
jgi:hypothetical protein